MIEQTAVINRRYRVGRSVGAGGMAVVYRGHDLLLGRDVAIKALRPQFAADPVFRARFEREAQAAAGFAHPHIIDIYDVGEEDGTPYIVMEFVRGQTLKEIILAEGPFHPDDVGALLEQVCAALDYAHERGYVHRDVKPQNILVDERGVAKVVDFGIAKGLADSDLTEVGAGLGTVHYLSPELASGLMATPASDIYSAGVVAFEMLTRHLPFDADSPVGVAMRHVHDAPLRPSAFAPGLPPAIDPIVLRALAKDPTKRYPSAGALARAMLDWRHASPDDRALPIAAAASTAVLPAAPIVQPPPKPEPDRRPTPSPAPSPAPPLDAQWAPGNRASGAAVLRSTPRSGRASPAPRSAPRDEIGCATWLVGIAILAGLIGLIWLGFRLSPGLAELGSSDPPPGDEAPAAEVPAATESVAADVPSAPTDTGAAPVATGAAPTPAVVPAPDLIGVALPDAERVANDRGLVLEQADPVASESIPVDAVAAQDPAPETPVEQGTSIRVRLSRGSDRIDIQALDLVGLDPAEAEAILRERGLGVAREEVPSLDVEPGLVAGTDPPDRAPAGSTVTIQISAGNRVLISGEIQGQPLPQVERQLTAMGLRVGGRYGVNQATIEAAGIDLTAAGIVDGDVVGVQGEGIDFGALVPPGTMVDLVFFDRAGDGP